jgi:hypothetical protein
MSHRLEDNEDTKYDDYKEPKTPMTYSTIKPDATNESEILSHQRSKGDKQTLDAEAIWSLERESGCSGSSANDNRGSFAEKASARII